ncbi:MAG: hypothetical protein NZM35_07685 [Chitinophagales bacterium]|nr:hypothetical protein [Chitinophagales bacterium]MDW8419831.1 hypothetical protein [Chitinophagales bacterium]
MVKKILLVLPFFLVVFYGCYRDVSTPPVVWLERGSGAVNEDTTLPQNHVFNVIVVAAKTGPDGYLKQAYFYKSVNNQPDTVLYEMRFAYTYFKQQYTFVTGDSGNIERYVFKFLNQSGQSASDTLTILIK